MFGPDGDLVSHRSHCLSVFPFLLAIYQSSLDEDVVEKDVHDDIVAGCDPGAHFHAAAHNMLCIQRKPSLAAPTDRLRSPFRDQLLPLSNAEEVLLDFTNNFHRLWGAVQSPSCPLEENHVDPTLVRETFFRN